MVSTSIVARSWAYWELLCTARLAWRVPLTTVEGESAIRCRLGVLVKEPFVRTATSVAALSMRGNGPTLTAATIGDQCWEVCAVQGAPEAVLVVLQQSEGLAELEEPELLPPSPAQLAEGDRLPMAPPAAAAWAQMLVRVALEE
jgi:hypothetical protein